jgi:PAS domain S-box-containing protein
LHVDYDPSILEISKQSLMDMGNFEFDSACGVDESFKKLATGNYDVVVSAYEMPQKDGLQFLKELREQNNEVPFILFTGKGREEIAVKALNLGANGYINKQGTPETVYGELAHVIQQNVERKKAELVVFEAREYAQNIMATMRESLLVLDDKLKVISANDSFYKTFEATPKETEGKCIYNLGNSQWDIPKLHELLEKIIPEKSFFADFEVEHVFPKIGHKTMLLNARQMFQRVKGVNLLLVAFEDITERKKTEETLLKSEHLLAESGRIGKVGGWNINIDTNKLTWTDETYRIHEVDQNFMPTVQNGISFYTPESRKIIEQAVQQAIAHGKPFNLELQIATAKGNIRSVRAIGEPNLANREVQGFFQDITERKKAEEALRIVTENLKRSNLELEQFAYVASHDLQEPLRMVTSYTQLIEQRYKGKLDANADEFIGYAVDGANRMRRLIDDLLSYSRVTRRGNPFKPIESELALDVALKNLQMAIEENCAEVTHDQLPEVMADEGQLVQILQNLIGNAIKFHSKETPRVHVSAKHLQETEYLFSVQDNGIGIDPQYFDRLFKIFQRLHTKEEYPGTGIGLALCKKIVDRHGGRIWLESQPGKGTTTYFTLNNKKGEKQEI